MSQEGGGEEAEEEEEEAEGWSLVYGLRLLPVVGINREYLSVSTSRDSCLS